MFEPIFPGFDPFIEDQVWGEFHNLLIGRMHNALARLLVPAYSVRAESYISLHLRPDVSIWRGQADTEPFEKSAVAVASATHTITPTIYMLDDQQRLEIRDTAGRLVTVLELLSPANKSRHRDRYLANRDAILSSETHLVEIDLLRGGERTEPDFPPEGYVIMVARAQSDHPHLGEVYEIGLRDPLPVIPVPLEQDEVPLNLPTLFKTVYEEARYRYQLNYRLFPSVPLASEDRTWVEALLANVKIS